MCLQQSVVLPAFLLCIAATAVAEKVDLTPSQLRKTATHVVVGRIHAVYDRSETQGDWKYTHYLAELRVDACEQGDGVKDGDLIYMRYWRRQWIGEGRHPTSTSGHRGLPNEQDVVRVYLARNAYDGFTRDNHDGGFNVIGANGFESIRPADDK